MITHFVDFQKIHEKKQSLLQLPALGKLHVLLPITTGCKGSFRFF